MVVQVTRWSEILRQNLNFSSQQSQSLVESARPRLCILNFMHGGPDLHQWVGEIVSTSSSDFRFEVFIADVHGHMGYPFGKEFVGDDDAVGVVILGAYEDLCFS